MAEASTEREPTESEKKNGWTKETLNRYLAERDAQKIDFATRNMRKQVVIQNTAAFNPFRW